MKFQIAENLKLPADAITQTFGFFGRKGSGKTYAAGRLAEEFLNASVQIVVLDPIGNWYGLRLDDTGKRPSRFHIPILGGEHGDVPLQVKGGAIVADFAVSTGSSMIVDVSHFRKHERKEFVTEFAEQLFHQKKTKRSPMHIIIEEAQVFAPQKTFKGEERMLGALEDIVRLGRNYGIGSSMISQRPQSVNTELRNQCEPLVVFQLVAKHERDAIGGWMEHMGVESDLEALAKLKVGECFFWSPAWLDQFTKTKFLKKQSFDASATPKIGEHIENPKQLGPVDLEALHAALKDTIERAKAEDPRELKRQIADLRRQLAAAPKERERVETERVEIPVIKDSQVKALERIFGRIMVEAERHGKAMMRFWQIQNEVAKALQESILGAVKSVAGVRPLSQTNPHVQGLEGRRRLARSVESSTAIENRRYRNASRTGEKLKIIAANLNGDEKLGKCETAILATLAQHGECDMGRLALLSGYRRSGGYKNSVSKLRTLGYLDGPNTGIMKITEAGLKVGEFDALPAGRELFNYWLNSPRMGVCEREIMKMLDGRRNGSTIDEIAEATEYALSGGFKNSLSKLRTAGVIVGRNTERMRLSEEML